MDRDSGVATIADRSDRGVTGRRTASSRRRGARWVAGLFGCFIALVAGATQAAIHDTAGSAQKQGRAANGFDRNEALAISQAALGRQIGDSVFTRVDGSSRRLSEYRGKPLVVSLVFTSCAHICPATTQQLRRGVELARQALGTDSFNVVTIGFDTARDTPSMMAEFARRQRIDLPGWDFLSADAATIERLTADLGFIYYRAGGGFDHLIQSTVIDEEGVVYRQVYGIDFKLPHLVEPLKELAFGLTPDQSIYEELSNRIRLFCTVYDPASGRYRFSYAIFVGLIVGLLMGAAAIYALIGEWRGYRRTRKGIAGA